MVVNGKYNMYGWIETTLGKLCHQITTGKLDANAMIADGIYPFFTCAKESYRINTYAFDCEALLVSGNGANVGYVHHYIGKFNAYQRTYVISGFDANPTFLNYYLTKNIQDRIRIEVNSGNTPYITMGTLTEMPISLPNSQTEQQAIAAALSDVDQLIASLDQLIEKRRALKIAAMQQLLTGKTRLKGFSGEWEPKRLGNLATIQRGASPRPIDNPIWFDDKSPIGWVRISDVTKSGAELTKTEQKLSTLGIQNSRLVSSQNLIMSICATVGRPIVTKIDVCIHDGFVVFGNLHADMKFIYHFLKWIEPKWSKYGQTGSQMNLNTELINRVELLLPSINEQKAIAEVLSDMDAEITELEQRREKTQAIKQGMMQELLTGRTRLI